ncbi:MAG: SDR family oxidoreductase, partial [Patescibacteria group bacterium]
FVLHSIGMSPNVRKNIPYTELNYDFYMKSMDVSAMSLHKMLNVAYKLDAISEWGSVVALSYIAAQKTYPFYSDMAEAKAMLESIVRSFGYHFGKKKKVSFEQTRLRFGELDKKTIDRLAKKNLDKSGSYAIQKINNRFIKEIKGDIKTA